MKRYKISLLVIVGIIFMRCGSEDPPIEPSSALLVSPINGDLCATAVILNEQFSNVTFLWNFSENTDSYTLVVKNDLNGTRISRVVPDLNRAELQLTRGAPYSWWVVSSTLLSEKKSTSATWQFYLEGVEKYQFIPFSALLLSPRNNQEISLGEDQDYEFSWDGNDLDDDISHYNLYLTVQSGNSIKELSFLDILVEERTISLELNSTYTWKVETVDIRDNKSMSDTRMFKTLK
ncbi:MAG: hypothetical protein OXC03_06320 [Flavobacteriaceae bacterium]|nr:hypothetical protein [Flavobacteriaceae bacterium]